MKAMFSLFLLLPTLAFAHAQLETAVPMVGGTVSVAPAELQLHFSEALEPRFCKVSVTTASGQSVTAGALHLDPHDGEALLVPVAKLSAGTYKVSWHAVSVDTHKTQGTYHFTVAP